MAPYSYQIVVFWPSMRIGNFLFIGMIPLLLGGCATIESKISGRTATEQHLVTEAVQKAVDSVQWKTLRGQKIKMDLVGVQTDEFPFIKTTIERELNRYHCQLVEDATKANFEMTVLVRSVGTDIWVSNFGIPLLVTAYEGVPSSAGGLSLFSTNKQEGYCRLEFIGRNPVSKELLWQIPVVHGDTYFKTTTFLGVFGPFKSSDVFPERPLIRPKGYVPLPRRDDD